MTTNEAKNLTGVERAMALDILDMDGVDRLVEDEAGIFVDEDADEFGEPDFEPDLDDVPDYIYNIHHYGL